MDSTQKTTSTTVTAELPDAEGACAWASQAMNNRNWQNAAERWAILRQVYPKYAPVWIQAAIAHRHLDELDKARALVEQACKVFPKNPNAWLQKAEIAIAEKHWQQAVQDLQYLQHEFPEHIAGWVRIADVYALSGESEKANETNAQARQKFSDRPWPWIQYAEFAMQEESYELALERWADVRQRFPEHAAGYQRAADAAEKSGNHTLSRKLKLAREYGNAWLESTELEEEESPHVITPPRRRNWATFCDLVWTKARLNLKSEANQNYLRYFWWVIDPILYMAVFYIVFGILMERGGPGFIPYLLTGLVPFQWFAKTVSQASNSITGGKGLMDKVRITPLFFPLVCVVQNTGKQLLVFAMLGFFLFFYGLPPNIHWLAFIPIVLTQVLLTVVVSCLLAMVIPFARDLSNLVPTGMQFLLFVSGIFYSAESIPEKWHALFFANPMASVIFQYRRIFIEDQWPVWSMLGWVVVGSLVGLGLVLWLYRRLEGVFPRVVLQ